MARQRSCRWIIASCLGAVALSVPDFASAMPVARVHDFLDSIGVNTHVEYTDSRYASVAHVLAALRYIGVDHARDAAPWHGNQGQAVYGLLADSGIHFEVFLNRTLPIQLDETSDLAKRHPGAVELLEGPNEVNNFQVSYLGQKGTAGAQAYQEALYDAAKGRPEFANVGVLLFTDYPDHPGKSDLGNFHSYPRGGGQPSETLAHDLADLRRVDPDQPVYCTEAGYTTLIEEQRGDGVPEDVAATLTANLLLDTFTLGVKRTYLYELFDEFADPGRKDGQKHYGLFREDYSPKPTAQMLHNLQQILGRDGAAAPTPTDLDIKVDGANSLLLQRTDGRRFLILWREVRVWDQTHKAPVVADPGQVKIRLDRAGDVSVFHPLKNTQANQARGPMLTLPMDQGLVIVAF